MFNCSKEPYSFHYDYLRCEGRGEHVYQFLIFQAYEFQTVKLDVFTYMVIYNHALQMHIVFMCQRSCIKSWLENSQTFLYHSLEFFQKLYFLWIDCRNILLIYLFICLFCWWWRGAYIKEALEAQLGWPESTYNYFLIFIFQLGIMH